MNDAANFRRHLDLEGPRNFRDVGGYATADGGRLRWGQLFRSDTLVTLSGHDLDVLSERGLRSVVDLRSPAEIDFAGRDALVASLPHYELDDHRPLDIAYRDPDESLAERYRDYLERRADLFAGGVLALATRVPFPTVVTCFFGKDRTGVLVALVLESLGVAREDVVADYTLSRDAMVEIRVRLKSDERYRESVMRSAPSNWTADPATMTATLNELDKRHGGVRAWLAEHGVTGDVLARLREKLVD